MAIGAKLVLRSTTVARGMLLLTPAATTISGGKVDAWDRRWRADRKANLQRSVEGGDLD